MAVQLKKPPAITSPNQPFSPFLTWSLSHPVRSKIAVHHQLPNQIPSRFKVDVAPIGSGMLRNAFTGEELPGALPSSGTRVDVASRSFDPMPTFPCPPPFSHARGGTIPLGDGAVNGTPTSQPGRQAANEGLMTWSPRVQLILPCSEVIVAKVWCAQG